ncbi:MAG: creatininase family protein [Litorilinea sp.]
MSDSTMSDSTMSDSTPKALFEDMTWPEARRAADDGGRVVLLPVGAIEQHAPHLPIDVDNRIVVWLCNEAAKARPDLILSAPPIHYGFNAHNMGFPGTISVEVTNFINYVYDVCNSFVRQGHTRIILLNGHGSNGMPCALVARQIINRSADALAAAINHWDLARSLAPQIRETPLGGAAHACEYETSWYLHLNPDGAKMEYAAPDMMPKTDFHWGDLLAGYGPVQFTDDWSRRSNGSGVEGDPTSATAEKGQRFAEEELHNLIRFCAEFKALPLRPRRDYTARGEDINPYADQL